jgi:acetyl esterase
MTIQANTPGPTLLSASFPYPPHLAGAARHVYSDAHGGLALWVFAADSSAPAPAIVLFFGGGWSSGSPGQFEQHARYLATRGVTCVLADYRVTSRHASTVRDSVADAQLAFAWVRSNAESLNVDLNRIAAGGGSAGGHVAAMLACLPDHDDRPGALLLFNPVLVLAREDSEWAHLNPPTSVAALGTWGFDPEELSPYHLIHTGLPPTLIQHGRADSIVPFAASEEYVRRRREIGTEPAILVGYDEQDHGFFNVGRSGGWPFIATLRRADEFLQSIGWVTGSVTLLAEPAH